MTRTELLERLTNEAGTPFVVLPWWQSAFEALDNPGIRELIRWLPRQSGKSQLLAVMALTELLPAVVAPTGRDRTYRIQVRHFIAR